MVNILPWLITFRAVVNHLDKSVARKTFVQGLVQADKLYHFDDDAADIYTQQSRTFTDEEAVLLNELRDILYGDGEELFQLALDAIN